MSKKEMNYSYYAVQKRYKSFKSKEIKHTLLKGNDLYIIRLDGKGMTKKFKENHVFHNEYYQTMKNIIEKLPSYFPHISYAYTCSDEISLLLNFKKIIAEECYKNNQEKILTIISSYVSSLFNKFFNQKSSILFVFDARLIIIRNNECIDYFKSRQAYSFCSFFDFVASKERRKIKNRTIADIENLLNRDYYKEIYDICYGYNAFYSSNKWTIEIAKNIEKKLKSIVF